MSNPFFYGGKVEKPSDFVGRKTEIQRIFSALETAHGGQVQHISIVGERRIGKSSLMYHVVQTYAQRLSHPECYRFVYVDLDDPHCHTLSNLLSFILSALGLTHSDGVRLDQFQDQITQLHEGGICPVICLDEFEHLTHRKEEFPDMVYEAWRSLGNQNKAAFITASHIPLVELEQQGKLTSPFHNIFLNINLLGFTHSECETLFARSAAGGRLFTLDEQRQLLRLAGDCPGKLQYAALLLYEAKGEPGIDWSRIEQDFKLQFPQREQEPGGKKAGISIRVRLVSIFKWILRTVPIAIGHFMLDVLGATDARESTAWVIGTFASLAVTILIIGIFSGWINLEQIGQAIAAFIKNRLFGNP